MRETWYVLEDGRAVHPSECAMDGGKLVHASGVAVARRGDAYSSRGVDPDEERSKSGAVKEMKPATPKRNYKTRESKAD